MRTPLVSIVIPTRNRPHYLPRAIESALAQTIGDVEVVVVDDGSDPPVAAIDDPRVTVVRHPESRGLAAALNTGVAAARGRWVAHLDDDDQLLPQMAELSLDAIARSTLPPPVAALSGVEVRTARGRLVQRRLPPTHPRGDHFSLEPLARGRAFETRVTLVVERELLQRVGGWDESLRSSVRHELFLRLNPVCSIVGLSVVTYQALEHDDARVSTNHARKHENFARIEAKHRALFEAHPARYAHYLRSDARRLFLIGRPAEAGARIAHALRLSPLSTAVDVGRLAARELLGSARRSRAARTRV